MEQQQIKIGIADRTYPLKINPADEEKIRLAVKMIGKQVASYKERFSNRDYQDALSLSLLQFAIKLIEYERNEELNGLIDELKLLDTQLEEYINTNL